MPSLPADVYMKVDPDNRLVADTLEAEWNESCAVMPKLPTNTNAAASSRLATLQRETRRRILGLAEQLPKIWNDPRVDFS